MLQSEHESSKRVTELEGKTEEILVAVGRIFHKSFQSRSFSRPWIFNFQKDFHSEDVRTNWVGSVERSNSLYADFIENNPSVAGCQRDLSVA